MFVFFLLQLSFEFPKLTAIVCMLIFMFQKIIIIFLLLTILIKSNLKWCVLIGNQINTLFDLF